jgi:hypothetical protein
MLFEVSFYSSEKNKELDYVLHCRTASLNKVVELLARTGWPSVAAKNGKASWRALRALD